MKSGGCSHPKTKRLARSLGVSIPTAIGHLELLFHFTNQYAPRGDLGRYGCNEIAEGCGWEANEEGTVEFVDALVATKWLDKHEVHGVVVHDWPEHAPDYTKRKMNDPKGPGWAVNDSGPEESGNPQNLPGDTGQNVPEDSGLLSYPTLPNPIPPNTDPVQTEPVSQPQEAGKDKDKKFLCPSSEDTRWTESESGALLRLWAWHFKKPKAMATATPSEAIEAICEWQERGGGKSQVKRTMRGWEATVRQWIDKGWVDYPKSVTDELPKGEAYTPEDHPREVKRRALRAELLAQVDSEEASGERERYMAAYTTEIERRRAELKRLREDQAG